MSFLPPLPFSFPPSFLHSLPPSFSLPPQLISYQILLLEESLKIFDAATHFTEEGPEAQGGCFSTISWPVASEQAGTGALGCVSGSCVYFVLLDHTALKKWQQSKFVSGIICNLSS